MADLSFAAGTTGMLVTFVVRDGGVPISNATSATVTWMAQDGRRRPLALADATAATFTYTLSAGDYPVPRYETGQLRVSIGTNVLWQGPFTVRVMPHL